MSDKINQFLLVTDTTDTEVASNFLKMASGDLDLALTFFFENGVSLASSSSGQHGGAGIDDRGVPKTNSFIPNTENDAELAKRLQREENGKVQSDSNSTRVPDKPVREVLTDPMQMFPNFGGVGSGNSMTGLNHSRGLRNPQRSSYNVFHHGDRDEEERGSSKLSELFRRPSDIISDVNFNGGKEKAVKDKKWLLVNIQDYQFTSATLNRDFWSNQSVKNIVKANFVFIQLYCDTSDADDYLVRYPIHEYPHIAIIDPKTGESQKSWSKDFEPRRWVSEVSEFLNSSSSNQERKKESLVDLSENEILKIIEERSRKEKRDPELEAELTEEDILRGIDAVLPDEPTGDGVTRVQIRTADGKRIVHKFKASDNILKIYQFVKATFEKIKSTNAFFTLSFQGIDLLDKLDETLENAGLKNASLLLEIHENDI